MHSRLLLLIISVLVFSSISHAKVISEVVHLVEEAEELESRTISVITHFAKDLISIYHQIANVRNSIERHAHETAEVFEQLSLINTSIACNSCEGFVSEVRRFDESEKVDHILEVVIEKLCDPFLNKTVCHDAITNFGAILIPALFDKELNSSHVCQNFRLCPRTTHRESLEDYIKDVLSDKPPKNIPTPTKKSTYKVLQLTDLHIDLKYEIGADAFCNEPLCCRADNGIPADPTKGAQYWGTVSHCDIPRRTYDQFLQFVSQNFDIDMILWSGDNISHDVWNQNVENQTVNTFDATEDMLRFFPNTSVYPMFGNHETYPADQYDFVGNRTSWLTTRLADLWGVWIHGDALETFREKSYYSVFDVEHNVKIIVLDTVACDSLDFYNMRNPTDPNGQLGWLRQELYDAEKNNLAVFIMSHIPPGDFNCDSQWSSRYRALVDRFSNIIRGQFFGHTHNDHFEVVRSFADDTPVGVVLIAPSLTTFSNLYPSFRVYEIDSETHQPVNYYQYRLDLDKWNGNTAGPIEWDLAYDFLSEYQFADMSFETFDTFAEKINNDIDVTNKFVFNLNSGGSPVGKLSKKAIANYYCGVKHSVSEDTLRCLGFKAQFSDLLWFATQLMPGRWYFDKC